MPKKPPRQIGKARSLRREMTDAEKKLWFALRSRQFSGYKFRRQHPIGVYIADFACIEYRLVIEADGGHHNGSIHDKKRDLFMQNAGWRVMRFWNTDILTNLSGVLEAILVVLSVRVPPHPDPLPLTGGEGKENEMD